MAAWISTEPVTPAGTEEREVAASMSISGARLEAEGNTTCWRLLRFVDPELEAEFVADYRARRRRQTLLMMPLTLSFLALEFVADHGLARLAGGEDATVAVRLAAASLGAALILEMLLTSVALRGVVNLELATILQSAVFSVVLFSSNTFRMSKLYDESLHQLYYGECHAEVCYSDCLLVLLLIGSVSFAMGFTPVRVSCSWVLVLLTIVLYGVACLPGIAPMQPLDHFFTGLAYGVVMFSLWLRCYWQEAEVRRRWLDTRQLRLQVQTQRHTYDLQQKWISEANERLEALQSSMSSTTRKSEAKVRVVDYDLDRFRVPPPHASWVSTMTSDQSSNNATEDKEPNEILAKEMMSREANEALARSMAERIRDPDYGMREFFDDALAAFPELQLFYVGGKRSRSSSGIHSSEEYQRTFGALFAVYWLLRLDIDGRQGMCFGCDEDWSVASAPTGPGAEKKRAFFEEMDWSLVREVVKSAIGDSTDSVERIQALLCLTAFHDVMKVPCITPSVSPKHAPYHRYNAGDVIHDHDLALAYVLEHYPCLLPSFHMLSDKLQEVVLFSQSRMNFNHGWFVQAEGPPGALLSSLKGVLEGASGSDLAFYFFHWLTDVAGAEGTPLAGAEKLTLKFPRAVLTSFLWSIPYIQQLAEHSETSVVECYLEDRFRRSFPDDPLPKGEGAVAQLRLAVMAQKGARLALDAFEEASADVFSVLSKEMARTGVKGQSFHRSPVHGGPAFLVYYGPALLQRCNSVEEMGKALYAMAAVYHAGRRLWPINVGSSGETVTLEVSQLKSMEISEAMENADGGHKIWVLVKTNCQEAALSLVTAAQLNRFIASRTDFVAVDFSESLETDLATPYDEVGHEGEDPISTIRPSEGTFLMHPNGKLKIWTDQVSAEPLPPVVESPAHAQTQEQALSKAGLHFTEL